MWLIFLLLISLVTVAILAKQAFLAVEQREFIPIPVQVNQTKRFRQ